MFRKGVLHRCGSVFIVIILICSGLLITLPNLSEQNIASATSKWTQSTDLDFQNGAFDNIILKGTGLDAELKINSMGSNSWTKMTPFSTTNPSTRFGHAMAPIYGTDKVLMFGGYSSLQDTWVYDLSDNTWTEKVKAPAATKPSARWFHGMAPVYNDDKVVLIGGNSNLNDTWIYDLSDDTWTEMKKYPVDKNYIYFFRISPHSYDDKIVIYSGGNMNSDTYVYDVSMDKWTKQSTTFKPNARSNHALASINGSDKTLLFAG